MRLPATGSARTAEVVVAARQPRAIDAAALYAVAILVNACFAGLLALLVCVGAVVYVGAHLLQAMREVVRSILSSCRYR